MATMKQIASLAGVSRGTVDRVLNNRGAVGAETETKIREIAAMVNYSPNRVGKTLSIRKKNLKLGFLLLGSAGSNPFIDEVLAGAGAKIRELAEYGVTVELRQSPLDDFVQQLDCMEELVGLGISGLAIMPVNHPAIAARLSALATQGMAIVTVNSDMEQAGRLAYVGSNYYKSGETAAGLMALMTGGTARIGIVTGSGSVLCHTERIKGFCDYMAAHYPAVTVAATVENHDDDFESFERTKAMLCADPGIDALYLTAGGVFGACRGVKDLGLAGKIRIISFDTVPTTRALVSEGVISATIDQQPLWQGSQPLNLLFEQLAMGTSIQQEYFYSEIMIKIAANL